MSLNQQDIALLEAYTYGDISASELSGLKQRISEDPVFAGEVRRWELMEREGFGITDQEEQIVSNVRNEITAAGAKLSSPKSILNKVSPFYYLTAAAMITGMLVFAWLMGWLNRDKTEYELLAEEYFVFLPADNRTLSTDDDDALSLEERAHAAYDREDYETALPLLLELVEQGGDSLELLYAGVAAVGSDQSKMAVQALTDFKTSSRGSYFANESSYYLGLAHLAEGKRDLAIRNLKDSSDDVETLGEKSLELITKLKK